MAEGVPAMIEGVHAAADGFWQWLMELPQSLLGLRQWMNEAGESSRDAWQRLKEFGNN